MGRHSALPPPKPIYAKGTGPSALGKVVTINVLLLLTLALTFNIDRTLSILGFFISLVFSIYLLRHLLFAISALQWAREDLCYSPDVDLSWCPPVTVLVAGKNEEEVISPMVEGMLALDYNQSSLQLIVVDDASDDATGEILDAWARKAPRLKVLHRAPGSGGGKSGALNDALPLVTGEIVVVFDADHVPQPDVLRRLVRHFRDDDTAAVMGRCAVRNGDESTLARTIALDYLSGYLVNQYGRGMLGLPAYGGANCAVRVSDLKAHGGWNTASVTEDTDITIRLLLAGRRVRYDVTAVDTEEAVSDLKRFIKQRYRWARGHQQVWRDYRWDMLKTKNLSLWEKIETFEFLLLYHVPLLMVLGFVLTILQAVGFGSGISWLHVPIMAALMFMGPMVEMAAGLIVAQAPRRYAWALIWFLPLYSLFAFVASKAWWDGLKGASYTWSKTARTGAGLQGATAQGQA